MFDLHDSKGVGGAAWKCPCPSGCKIRNGGYIKGENLGRHLEAHTNVADVDIMAAVAAANGISSVGLAQLDPKPLKKAIHKYANDLVAKKKTLEDPMPMPIDPNVDPDFDPDNWEMSSC